MEVQNSSPPSWMPGSYGEDRFIYSGLIIAIGASIATSTLRLRQRRWQLLALSSGLATTVGGFALLLGPGTKTEQASPRPPPKEIEIGKVETISGKGSISQMPRDILLLMMDCLHSRDLSHLGQTCRYLYHLADNYSQSWERYTEAFFPQEKRLSWTKQDIIDKLLAGTSFANIKKHLTTPSPLELLNVVTGEFYSRDRGLKEGQWINVIIATDDQYSWLTRYRELSGNGDARIGILVHTDDPSTASLPTTLYDARARLAVRAFERYLQGEWTNSVEEARLRTAIEESFDFAFETYPWHRHYNEGSFPSLKETREEG